MRRRNVKGVMDTSEEGDEEDNAEMSGVVMTMDLGGFQASEDREKVNMTTCLTVKDSWMHFFIPVNSKHTA